MVGCRRVRQSPSSHCPGLNHARCADRAATRGLPCMSRWTVLSPVVYGAALGSGGALQHSWGHPCIRCSPVALLHLRVRVATFGVASFALCYGQRGGPDTSAPKAVRGQKRLSTLAEALPLAREIGAGSRAPREIDAGSRGCRSLWRVRSMRDHTPSGIVPWKE